MLRIPYSVYIQGSQPHSLTIFCACDCVDEHQVLLAHASDLAAGSGSLLCATRFAPSASELLPMFPHRQLLSALLGVASSQVSPARRRSCTPIWIFKLGARLGAEFVFGSHMPIKTRILFRIVDRARQAVPPPPTGTGSLRPRGAWQRRPSSSRAWVAQTNLPRFFAGRNWAA
ncbi:hypothetical protein B0T24DRAFT_630879 [Lasiosphaeria ovina]|uniref:Uncharacterized protein n=1 Tax=Lasiosphaeria ovina TaxID=92902 RepID=A0AAE0N310_9PEZI|nr:hypothetical protein B0T24DRAFT_630879 [Lasiosphaeria ovina]